MVADRRQCGEPSAVWMGPGDEPAAWSPLRCELYPDDGHLTCSPSGGPVHAAVREPGSLLCLLWRDPARVWLAQDEPVARDPVSWRLETAMQMRAAAVALTHPRATCTITGVP